MGFLALAFYREVSAEPALKIYESGYKLEKTYPLFAIPLYEKVLRSNPNYKLKRITATRLYYLYKKFRKYPELLTHYSRYRTILSLGKEHSSSIGEILKVYRITGTDFYEIYPLLSRIDSENIGEILDKLVESSNKNLFHFSYFYLISMKKYEELRTLMFYLPETIARPILKIGLLVKMGSDSTEDVVAKFLENEELNESQKSDSFYLLGQYYLQQKNYTRAEEFFFMSIKHGKEDRSRREIAKILISQGSIQTACQSMKHKPRPSHEMDQLLYLTCSHKKNIPREMKYSVEILRSQEPYHQEFYDSIMRWFWNSR